MNDREGNETEGQMWRDSDYAGRWQTCPPIRLVDRLSRRFWRGAAFTEEQRRFKVRGLKTALENMPPDSRAAMSWNR